MVSRRPDHAHNDHNHPCLLYTSVNAMIDQLVANALKALEEYMKLDQEQVDKIVHAMALAGLDNHMPLAKLAYEETGRGVMEDKIIKNMFASEYIWHDIKYAKTVGIVDENDMEGYVEVAEPVGVVAGVCLLYTSASRVLPMYSPAISTGFVTARNN